MSFLFGGSGGGGGEMFGVGDVSAGEETEEMCSNVKVIVFAGSAEGVR